MLPNEGMYSIMERDRKESLANSKQNELSFGAAWFYGFSGDVTGHNGWGGTVSFLFSPPAEAKYPDWRVRMGLELLVFHSNGSENKANLHIKESLDAGALNLMAGIYYTIPWKPLDHRVEVGAQVGFGLGGTFLETREDYALGGHKVRRNGNIDWAMQVHPRVTFHITDHSNLTLGYRFGFITPVLRTEGFMRHLTNYRTVDIVHQSLEAAFTVRF
ncbi:MAG: hypothetical protein LBG65_02440 [Puniceicoccales bacterium]|nr:hypothetical protein [Puniceicoccales bacterium]